MLGLIASSYLPQAKAKEQQEAAALAANLAELRAANAERQARAEAAQQRLSDLQVGTLEHK